MSVSGRAVEHAKLRQEERLLVERCQKGDLAAFNELVQRYEKQVYTLAYRLCGNHDDAEDIAAEVFLRVFNALPRFRGDAQFSTWLYRVVTNVYLDTRKRRSNHPVASLEDYLETDEGGQPRQVQDTAPSPQEELEANERREVLQRAIQALPEFQRIMITLYHVEELPYEQISEILQMPLGTVKSRLNRARRALRDHLVAQGELFE
ncbi:MAG TPA: sigma-70 family RNA polymerase sigma factor [Armatimonadota bacterium]|jgi:RNA polymerase sigma-70 factor (ECF subfamily)